MFDRCIAVILKNEGGYVNDPKDPGGETNFGISKKAYPGLDIATLTESKAKEIYRKDYWEKVHADEIRIPSLALQVFDCAVNCGVSVAAKMLQRCVGTHQDGIVGSKTLAAVNFYPRHGELVQKYRIERCFHYMALAGRMKNSYLYINGWGARIRRTNFFVVNTPLAVST